MNALFAWVPWFRELAQKIADGGPEELSRRARKISWKADGTEANLLKYGDKNIDPFSVFYVLASKNHWDSVREKVHAEFSEQFHLANQADFASGYYYPTPNPRAKLLFHDAGDGDPDLLWRLLRTAVQGSDAMDGPDFDRALAIPGVGVPKLTETLFLINPTAFLPFDNQSLIPLSPELNNVRDWTTYRKELKRVRAMFPGCEPYEIQHFAYSVFGVQKADRLDVNGRTSWQSSTYVDGADEGLDYWENFRENGWIFHRGPGSEERTRPLHEPARGDVVLVRTGMKVGRGIGVVERNEHRKDWDPEQRLHLLWINASDANLTGNPKQAMAFSRAGKMEHVFRNAPEYEPTFDLLERLGWRPDSSPVPGSDLKALAEETLIDESELQRIKNLLDNKPQVIFQGPPGTGKTYLARKLAECLAGSEDRVRLVQFHPSYSYEDFVQGYRPTLRDGQAGFKLRDGPLREMAELAERSDAKHFLVIDEINRGNLSKILGELYYLLEYRDEKIQLQYGDAKDRFRLPPNLYIIGTMNTADRSIALVDLALRRRFHFVKFHPDEPPIQRLLRRWLEKHELDEEFGWVENVIRKANEKLADRHAALGPSYFMPRDKMLSEERISRIWEHNVMPYIEERLFGQETRLKEFALDQLRKEADGQSAEPDDQAAEGASGADEPDDEAH